VEKTESLKTFYTDTTEGKKFENYEARISKLLSKEHLDSEEMAILQKLQNEYSSFINSHLQEVSSLGSKEELESIDIKIKELTASSNKFKQSIEDINKAHSNQED